MARSEKNLTAVFTDTADAIRAKKGTSANICPLDFADEITSIPGGQTLLTPNCDFGIFINNDPYADPEGFAYYSNGWRAASFPDGADGSYWFTMEHGDGSLTRYKSHTLIIDKNGVIQPGFGEGTTVKLILPILSPVTIVGGTALGTFIFGTGENTSEEVQNYNVEFYTMDNVKIGTTMRLGDCFGGNGC